MLDKKNIFISIGILIFSFLVYIITYNIGYNAGSNDVSLQWEKDKLSYQTKLNSLTHEYLLKEQKYKEQNLSIVFQLNEFKQKYEKDINDINNTFNSKLLQSEHRASLYRDKAKAGETEREELAAHAARLDRALVEGQQLVKELRSNIELRDNSIKSLITQLKNDRKLLEDN